MQQATCAHSGADTGTSSGNIDTTTAPSRRALLGFVGVGAAALAAPIAVAAMPIASVSPAMRAALDAHAKAEAASRAFDATVYEPRFRAFMQQSKAVPHTVIDINRIPGIIATWTTANPADVAHCRRLVAAHRENLVDFGRDPSKARGTAHDLVAAADAREAIIEQIRQRTGASTACKRSDQLGDQAWRAAEAVVKLPAVTPADLVAKIEHIEGCGFETDGWVWEAITADIRHLASMANRKDCRNTKVAVQAYL